MICKQCGKEVFDNAIFCKYCGERLDGKIPCLSCGQLNESDNSFCVYCGARIDGKTVCKNCGVVYDGNFCPACGYGIKTEQKDDSQSKMNQQKKDKKQYSLLKKICDITGSASLMIGMLFALIFVFFISVRPVVDGSGLEWEYIYEEFSNGLKAKTTNIFYFFGGFSKDMKELKSVTLEMTPWFSNFTEEQITLYGTIGTIISVGTLVCVVIFSILASVRYILGWLNKTNKKADGFAFYAILSFIIGALVFFAHCSSTFYVESKEESYFSIKLWNKFNDGTIAAIIVCAISVVISILCRLIHKGKTFWNGNNIAKIITAFIGVIFSSILLGIVQSLGFGFSIGPIEEIEMNIRASFMGLSSLIDLVVGRQIQTGPNYFDITQQIESMTILNDLSTIFAIGLTIFAGLSLESSIFGVAGEKDSGFVSSICAFASAVIILIFTIIAVNNFQNIFELLAEIREGTISKDIINGQLGRAICLVVFSALLMIVSLVRMLFVKKEETRN